STGVRPHLAAGDHEPQHRRASGAFLHFSGTDAHTAVDGLAVAAEVVGELVADVQAAADRWEVCYLDSDVDSDGGKILLSAGAPRAVGDDEERMLLALRQILDKPRRLPVRIGVNRGPVFTGEIGPPYRRAYIVMGDTTNLAARVMSKTPVGQLWATEGILARGGARFVLEQQPPFAAKGKAKPVQAWAVGAATHAVAADAGAEAAPFVGRGDELAVLTEAIVAAGAGLGRCLDVVGDAGVGKSRLLAQAVAAAPPGLRLLTANCEAHLSGVPYSLWHAVLRRLLDLGWSAPAETVADALARRCADVPGTREWLPLLGDAAGVDLPATPETEALLPQYRAARLVEVLAAFLGPELAEPTVLEIDSAHLIDEASAGLLAGLLPRLADSKWAVAALRRAGSSRFDAVAAAGAQRLDVGPLDGADTRTLAQLVTDAAPLPPHVLDVAVTRSGGNPQFLFDLLAARGGELPDSAQAAAMAQLDALPPGDRSLLRRVSLLGSTFPPRLVDAVLDGPAGDGTWERLDALIATTPDGHLRFRRAAVQEAAYAALPYAERRTLHARVAEALEAGVAGEVDPGVLAFHYRRADRHDRAWPLNRTAARRAAELSAPADAVGLYRDALESAREIGVADPELAPVWEGLGDALRLAAETEAADRAYRNARRCVGADAFRQAELLLRQARLAHRAGHPAAGIRWARRGVRALDGESGPLADAWRARLIAAEAADRMDQGRSVQAIALCRRALTLAGDGATEVGLRARAHAAYLLDWALVVARRPAEAVHSADAVEIYDRLGDLEEKAKVLNNLGMFAYWEGRWDDAVRLYRECGELAERTGDVETVACSECNVGEVLSDQGHWDAATVALQAARRNWQASGNDGGAGFARMLLGRTAARQGRFAEAVDLLTRAVEELSVHGMDDAVLARAYLAEAFAYAGERARALPLIEALLPTVGPRERPLVQRAAAIARRDEGADISTVGLLESLATARSERCDYDVALALDLLSTAGHDGVAERNDLFSRLGIVRVGLPATPVGTRGVSPATS
ncbi:MAG: ATP-binding protein, partial [Sporichthyaceae bacterium]